MILRYIYLFTTSILFCLAQAESDLRIVSLYPNRAIVVQCLPLNITCETSTKEAQIWWTLNGGNVTKDLKDIVVEQLEEKSTLSITCPHNTQHSGQFMCHAVKLSDLTSYTNKSIQINVKALESIVKVHSKPYIISKINDEVSLKCTATANTSWYDAKVDIPRWSINDKDVNGLQVTIKQDENRSEVTLIIASFKFTDAGLYTCKVGSTWNPITSNTYLIASAALAPTNINVKMLNQSGIIIYWPLLQLDSLRVQYYLLNISYNGLVKSSVINENQPDSLMDNLKMHMWQLPEENTFYTFTVCACLAKGLCGDFSQPTVLAYFKDFEKPEKVVVQCRHDNISLESFLDVNWDLPQNTISLPVGVMYQIEVTGLSRFRTSNDEIRIDADTQTYTSPNLWWRQRMKSNTNYTVQVCVQTAYGCGQRSQYSFNTSCSTPPSVPAEIPSMKLNNMASHECACLVLDLVRVTERYGSIKCYRIILYKLKDGQTEVPDSATMSLSSYHEVHADLGFGAYVAESFSSDDFKSEVVLGDEIQSECEAKASEKFNYRRKRRNENNEFEMDENSIIQIYDGKLDPGASYSGFVEIVVDGFSGNELRRRSPAFPIIQITSQESESAALPTALGVICGLCAIILILVVALCLLRKKNLERPQRDAPILPQPSMDPIRKDQLVSAYLERHKDSDMIFQREYELLPEYFNDRSSRSSDSLDNIFKNRYPDIKAYDQTRVKLKAVAGIGGSDYINANIIPGYKNRKKFICAQGPLEKTVNDFWRMIWEQKVEVIAMVTGLEENGKCKCAKYWPDSGEQEYGNLTVKVTQECAFGDYSIRQFVVKEIQKGDSIKTDSLTVTQFHYTAWRDFLAPDRSGGILKFMRRLQDAWKQPNESPLLVHCSAGVGRSGTLIAIDILLEQLKEESQINVYQTVVELRRHRNFMVQSLTQYIFIYRAVMEHYQFGYTEIDLNFLAAHLETLEKDGLKLLQAEFNKLDEIVEDHKTTDVGSMDPNNAKNRYDYILPFDKNRVVLTSIPKEDSSTYINASIVLGCDRSISYILTQDPLESTICDFWRMIYEQNVCCIVMLSQSIGNNKDECPIYWPNGEDSLIFKHITVRSVEDEEESDDQVKRKFFVTSMLNSKELNVVQYQFKNWTSNLPESQTKLLRLVEIVWKEMNEKGGKEPVVVHCTNGGERSSLFTALSLLIGQAIREEKVDVFHTICNLRSERQLMIPSLDHYHFCFKAILEYAKSYHSYYSASLQSQILEKMSEAYDANLVQIKADKKEIDRRIAAFMLSKRREVDELNLQEFCNVPRAEMASEFSCARVDAVYVHRVGDKGHVKVSRAYNDWGPQTMASRVRKPQTPLANPKVSMDCPEGIEERLHNLETHFKCKTVPNDIYQRLKNIEDRVLFLEGSSPEYFN